MQPAIATESCPIDVEHLSVTLRREQRRVRSLREYMVARVQGTPLGASWFDALHDVSFAIERGELFAIVGPNGAGKTTLLRTLAGILPPAAGRVRVHGTIAPLIELGAGFDPELTGAENLELYASFLGVARHASRSRRGAVAEFAGLTDEMFVPVKNYSSGMVARLGFAVATEIRPEVLLVDEVLAVGDDEFRSRCAERIASLRAAGTTIVLVTHDMRLVEEQADRALLLEAGRVRACGAPAEVVAAYRSGGTA